MLPVVNAIHLFTFRGIPVFVSPMYFLLLVMFGYRDPAQGIIWAIAITLSLLVHEFGHALVARRLRHEPTIMLHGFGGLTARSRRGRDVDEAAIVAMGPAAGLALGLLAFGMWQLAIVLGPSVPLLRMIRPLLYTCILWNLLNLLPLWPLDGGQLFQLGLGRLMSPARAARATHIVALAMIAFLAVFAPIVIGIFLLIFAVFFVWFAPKVFRAIKRIFSAVRAFFAGEGFREVARRAP